MRFHRLHFALLISLALHVLVLWTSLRGDAGASAPLLRGELRPAIVPTKASTQALATANASHAPLLRPGLSDKVIAPAPQEPHPALVSAIPLSAPPAAMASAAPSLALPSADVGPDAGGLRRYRLNLALQLGLVSEFKRNLPAGLSGTVVLHIDVAQNGALLGIDVGRSSGHALIDQAAVNAVRQAARQAAIPNVLQGRAFTIELPIEIEG